MSKPVVPRLMDIDRRIARAAGIQAQLEDSVFVGADFGGDADRTMIFSFQPLSTIEIARLQGFDVRRESPPCTDFTPSRATSRAPWSAVAAEPVEPTDITFNDKKRVSE